MHGIRAHRKNTVIRVAFDWKRGMRKGTPSVMLRGADRPKTRILQEFASACIQRRDLLVLVSVISRLDLFHHT
jgi:hypothetical protein